MPDLAPVAAEMTERGFSVSPLLPDSKRPAVKWRNVSTADTELVLAEWPGNGNIGVDCGASGLIVVDLDVHSADGVNAFTKLCEEHEADQDWPDTLIVATPSGGFHLYFTAVEGLGNGTGALPKGMTSVATAAMSSATGRRSAVGRTRSTAAAASELPAWLLGIIKTPRRKDRPQTGNERPQTGKDRPQTERRSLLLSLKMMSRLDVEKAVNGILNKLATAGEGDRNALLYWASCRIFEYVAAGRINGNEAEAALLAAAEINGVLADDGEHQCRKTIDSARTAVA